MEYLYSILLSIAPISELRGGIPYAISQDIHFISAYFICVVSNMFAFPIVYFFLEFLHPIFMKVKLYENLFDRLVVRTRKKLESSIDKWGFWGLMIFVMIPLPVTGAWTGSFGAWLFNIRKNQAFLAVTLGIAIAGIIVTTIVVGGLEALSFLKKDIHI